MTTDIEPQPRSLGYCIGIPGAPCGRKVYDSDVMAVVIPGRGPIGSCCQDLLLGAKAWSGQFETNKSAAQSAGGKKSAARGLGISFPGSKQMHPKQGARPHGSELSARSKSRRRT